MKFVSCLKYRKSVSGVITTGYDTFFVLKKDAWITADPGIFLKQIYQLDAVPITLHHFVPAR